MQRDVIHADEKSDWHSVLSQFQAADDDNRDGPQMADLHSVLSQLQSSVTQLQSSVAALTTTINESLAKVEDPLEKVLEKLIKDRDELSRLVLVIASLSSVSTFFSPPGGLDSNGHIRFRDTQLFRLYHVFAGLTFAVSFANLSFLHKPLEEQKEKALKGLRKRMNIAGILLWVATVFFFIAFVLGFWIVYPDADPVTLRPNSWPRWFTLALAIVKVGSSLAIVFIRRVWAYLFP